MTTSVNSRKDETLAEQGKVEAKPTEQATQAQPAVEGSKKALSAQVANVDIEEGMLEFAGDESFDNALEAVKNYYSGNIEAQASLIRTMMFTLFKHKEGKLEDVAKGLGLDQTSKEQSNVKSKPSELNRP